MDDEKWSKVYTAGYDSGYNSAVRDIEIFLFRPEMNPMSAKWKKLRQYIQELKNSV